jgi:hypothetical protein
LVTREEADLSGSSRGDAAFAAIVERLRREPGVEEGTGFGRNPGLRARGKIFAMLVDGDLVVKLPADRCAAVVAAGGARPFDRGRGQVLREWIAVSEASEPDWPGLADEALAFARR